MDLENKDSVSTGGGGVGNGGDGGDNDDGDISGEGIWDWANDHDGLNDSTDEPFPMHHKPTRCTIFCSTALHIGGGVPTSQKWNPDEDSWIQTDMFYSFLTTDLNLSTIGLDIVPAGGNMMSIAEINTWFERNEIPEGSFVFYDIDNQDIEFSHVGIIGPVTTQYHGITAPIMTDMDGSSVGPRSILNTTTFNHNMANPTNLMPFRIVIVIVPEN
jgi:hypothetical protein